MFPYALTAKIKAIYGPFSNQPTNNKIITNYQTHFRS